MCIRDRSNEIRHFDAPSETELSGQQPMSNSVMVPTGRHSVLHRRCMEPRALSLHEIRRPMEMFSQNVSRVESVERGLASVHVATKIARNFTSGAHESIGNVIDQRAGRPSASILGPNERVPLQDKHAHGCQSAFSYTSGRNADGVSLWWSCE